MKQWLTDSGTDGETRTIQAVQKLLEARQAQGQSFQAYLDDFEAIESEFPFELPVAFSNAALIVTLLPDLREKVDTKGVAVPREEVVNMIKRAELSTT